MFPLHAGNRNIILNMILWKKETNDTQGKQRERGGSENEGGGQTEQTGMEMGRCTRAIV